MARNNKQQQKPAKPIVKPKPRAKNAASKSAVIAPVAPVVKYRTNRYMINVIAFPPASALAGAAKPQSIPFTLFNTVQNITNAADDAFWQARILGAVYTYMTQACGFKVDNTNSQLLPFLIDSFEQEGYIEEPQPEAEPAPQHEAKVITMNQN